MTSEKLDVIVWSSHAFSSLSRHGQTGKVSLDKSHRSLLTSVHHLKFVTELFKVEVSVSAGNEDLGLIYVQ